MATSGDKKPTYIYKLVPHTAPVPDDLPDALPVSDLDQTSGFVHLSTSRQVPGTLQHFFKDHPHVYILRLVYDALAKHIQWEDPKGEVCGPRCGEGMFPHLYNGLKLGREEVESVRVLTNGGGGGWEEAIEADASFKAWFIY